MIPDYAKRLILFNDYDHLSKWIDKIPIDLWEDWSRTTGVRKELEFTEESTGDYVRKVELKGAFELYTLKLIETYRTINKTGIRKNSFVLTIGESPHQNHYKYTNNRGNIKGENYERLTLEQYKYEVNHLYDSLHLHNLNVRFKCAEVGVNLRSNFSVDNLLMKQILAHKTMSVFSERVTKMENNLGYVFKHESKVLKAYNKGK